MVAPVHLGSVLPRGLVKTCVEIVQYPHSSRKFGLARTGGVRQAVQLFELFLLKQCCNSVFLLVKGLKIRAPVEIQIRDHARLVFARGSYNESVGCLGITSIKTMPLMRNAAR